MTKRNHLVSNKYLTAKDSILGLSVDKPRMESLMSRIIFGYTLVSNEIQIYLHMHPFIEFANDALSLQNEDCSKKDDTDGNADDRRVNDFN